MWFNPLSQQVSAGYLHYFSVIIHADTHFLSGKQMCLDYWSFTVMYLWIQFSFTSQIKQFLLIIHSSVISAAENICTELDEIVNIWLVTIPSTNWQTNLLYPCYGGSTVCHIINCLVNVLHPFLQYTVVSEHNDAQKISVTNSCPSPPPPWFVLRNNSDGRQCSLCVCKEDFVVCKNCMTCNIMNKDLISWQLSLCLLQQHSTPQTHTSTM